MPSSRWDYTREREFKGWPTFVSPGRQANGPPRLCVSASLPGRQPMPVKVGNNLVLFSDGSFRSVTERRPAGLSGRQRRNQRKLVRRALKAHAQQVALFERQGYDREDALRLAQHMLR